MSGDRSGNPARIVVGIDGSQPSKAALRWALRQARLTGATVDAVIAWDFPATYGWQMAPLQTDDIETAATKTIEATINDVVGSEPGVPVHPHVTRGHAAQVLLDAADDAELIVVGNRGHGGFAGALLGSVSQHCVQHAPCPVVVVRGT